MGGGQDIDLPCAQQELILQGKSKLEVKGIGKILTIMLTKKNIYELQYCIYD